MPLASVYLVAQAVLVAAWWAVLAFSPAFRLWFRPSSGTDDMLLAFWLADLLCIAGGSLLAAWWLRVGHRRRVHALWFLSGAMAYATLYCLALVALTREAWLGAVLMVPAASVTIWIAWRATSQ